MRQKRVQKALEVAERLEKLVGLHGDMFAEFLGPTDAKSAREAAETLRSLYEELHMTVSISEGR